MTQTVTATDSVSSQSFPNACGNYLYEIYEVSTSASVALSSSELTINSITGLISIYTTNYATVGVHLAAVEVSLPGYTAYLPPKVTWFQVIIQQCKVKSFTMIPLSPLYDRQYTIADSAMVWSILGASVTIQVPACGYLQTLTASNTLTTTATSTTTSSINFSSYSRDVLDAGSHTVTLVSTLNNYPYGLLAPACQSTFTLRIKDPC